MEEVIRRLRDILNQHFPGAVLELEGLPSRRVAGMVIWDGFTEMSPSDRQAALWSMIRHELTRDEQMQLSFLVTLTPSELTASRED